MTRVAISGAAKEAARTISRMSIHHFSAILSPLLGGILLPAQRKPSYPLFNYSSIFSWHPVNHSMNEMLLLAPENLRKKERNTSFKRWGTSSFRDLFFISNKSARPGDEPDSPSPKVIKINQKIYFTVERAAFPLDGLFLMSFHHPEQDPSYLPDFVCSLSSLSGSPILSQSSLLKLEPKLLIQYWSYRSALHLPLCKGQPISILALCLGDWYKISCALFMSSIKTSKNRYLADKTSRGFCCKSEHI